MTKILFSCVGGSDTSTCYISGYSAQEISGKYPEIANLSCFTKSKYHQNKDRGDNEIDGRNSCTTPSDLKPSRWSVEKRRQFRLPNVMDVFPYRRFMGTFTYICLYISACHHACRLMNKHKNILKLVNVLINMGAYRKYSFVCIYIVPGLTHASVESMSLDC